MTQKERLLKLILNSPFPKDILQFSKRSAIECDIYCSDIESFVDYLLQNGVIVPPCKVGDTVFVIVNGKIKEIVVDVISWTGFLFTFNDDRVYVDERQAYYTREAAQKALDEKLRRNNVIRSICGAKNCKKPDCSKCLDERLKQIEEAKQALKERDQK